MYYLAAQLGDAVDEYENPAICDFLKDARRQFVEREGFQLFRETRNYIKGVICHYLFGLEPISRHLEQIMEAAKDASVSKIEIFTLNHDLLIEAVLDKAEVQYEDGFVPIHDDLRRWDRQKFAMSPVKVRLSKLHGAVDWHAVRFSRSEASCVCIGRRGNIALEHSSLLESPAMLIGTFNKMLDYTMGIHADLFCAFRAALSGIDRLVISGYSFGDKGINASVAEWILANSDRRLLIIAPHASEYSRTARGAIRNLFTRVPERIETMDVEFEKVSWQEMHKKVVQTK